MCESKNIEAFEAADWIIYIAVHVHYKTAKLPFYVLLCKEDEDDNTPK